MFFSTDRYAIRAPTVAEESWIRLDVSLVRFRLPEMAARTNRDPLEGLKQQALIDDAGVHAQRQRLIVMRYVGWSGKPARRP